MLGVIPDLRLVVAGVLTVVALVVGWELYSLKSELAGTAQELALTRQRARTMELELKAAEQRRQEARNAAARLEASRAATRRELAALREQVRQAGGGCGAALEAIRRAQGEERGGQGKR